jgi:hypothetical protein
LQKICDQKGVQLELTAPDTPQPNGIVERRIALIIQRGNAMMIQAGLNEETKAILWPEAVDCANGVENITSTTKSSVPAHTRFTGEVSKLYPNVIKFGRVVYVTTKRHKFKGKWKERATNKSIMIGYAKNHAADTNHLMYNPKNRTVIETRDLCGDPKKIWAFSMKTRIWVMNRWGLMTKSMIFSWRECSSDWGDYSAEDDSDVEAGRKDDNDDPITWLQKKKLRKRRAAR